ncbi:hypothetical protein CASFOL_019436 [Castilleja foliolosa]|uniref:Pentatricopeptide repeat-containing protein n=1 Tax=Castilleja foliolosa TaxID=1961234 RepID=A0ABD3D559_9LAMI
MRKKGVSSDGYTFPILSKVAALLESGGACFAGMVHCLGMRMGFQSDVYFCNTMIEGYVRSGCFGNALKVFDEMPSRDLVSWTSMISGCVSEGNTSRDFGLLNEMRKEVEPNEVTLIVMLQTCPSVLEVRQFHGYVIKCGSSIDQSLKNSILKKYVDFDIANDSEVLFEETGSRDVVSWNIMIHLYSSKGNSTKVIDCLNKMICEVKPSIETFTLIISGLGEFENHSHGQQIHCLALKSGFFDEILSTCLLDLYAKSGHFEEAIEIFKQMLAANVKPDPENMRSFVVACMHLGALRLGKAVHGFFIRNYFSVPDEEGARSLETSILNMYVKCGYIFSARNCFNKMLVKDLVTWSSMIEGYGTHGLGFEALKIFDEMKSEKVKPNSITFLSLLSACSHSGAYYAKAAKP